MAASVRGEQTLSVGEKESLKAEFQLPAGFGISSVPTANVELSRGAGNLTISDIAINDDGDVVSYKCMPTSACTRGSVFFVTITASAEDSSSPANVVGPLKVSTRITIAGEG